MAWIVTLAKPLHQAAHHPPLSSPLSSAAPQARRKNGRGWGAPVCSGFANLKHHSARLWDLSSPHLPVRTWCSPFCQRRRPLANTVQQPCCAGLLHELYLLSFWVLLQVWYALTRQACDAVSGRNGMPAITFLKSRSRLSTDASPMMFAGHVACATSHTVPEKPVNH